MLQNHRSWLEYVLAVTLAAALVGCSKKAEPESPEPAAPALKSAPAEESTAADWLELPASPAKPAVPAPSPEETPVPEQSSGNPAEQVAALEQRYLNNPELGRRLDVIFKLAELDGQYAVPALAKLFQVETDIDLKIEILDALVDINGGADAKLTLLTAALHPQQHQEVREAALEALADLGDPRALPIVQQLLADPDLSIRQQALRVVDQLRMQSTK